MTKATVSKSMRRLPVSERIELLDELWHSIAADQDDIPVPDWQKKLIDERLAQIEANPNCGMSLEEFQKKLRGLKNKFKAKARSKNRRA